MTGALARHQVVLAYGLVASMSAATGLAIARSPGGVPMSLLALIGLSWLIILVSLPPTTLFMGWLILAPIFADAVQASSVGQAGARAVYIVPALVLAATTLLRLRRTAFVSKIEFLPAAFVAYVLASTLIATDAFQTDPFEAFRVFFLMVALGPLVYYFLTLGPGVDVPRDRLLVILMASAAVQGVLALVEAATLWNLWGYTVWHGQSGARAVSTLANPGILGMFVGVGVVLALALLTWRGPRAYHRLAFATILVCLPGLFVTFTRGPILATLVGSLLVLVFGNKRWLGVALIAASVVAIAALWPSISSSELYQARVRQSDTVQARIGLQKWSFELAERKPAFGWGYGSFDRVKNTEELDSIQGIPIRYMLEITSHNTYLTFLVELGVVGLLLYVTPFLVFGWRAFERARAGGPDTWIIAGSLGSLIVVVLTAVTIDFRFFSFAQLLPWLFLAILREPALHPASADRSA